MAKMMKMDVGGTIRDVIEVPFEIVKEPWAEYEMLDGGRLRVRHILQRLFDAGEIYQAEYRGFYSTRQEQFLQEGLNFLKKNSAFLSQP